MAPPVRTAIVNTRVTAQLVSQVTHINANEYVKQINKVHLPTKRGRRVERMDQLRGGGVECENVDRGERLKECG